MILASNMLYAVIEGSSKRVGSSPSLPRLRKGRQVYIGSTDLLATYGVPSPVYLIINPRLEVIWKSAVLCWPSE